MSGWTSSACIVGTPQPWTSAGPTVTSDSCRFIAKSSMGCYASLYQRQYALLKARHTFSTWITFRISQFSMEFGTTDDETLQCMNH